MVILCVVCAGPVVKSLHTNTCTIILILCNTSHLTCMYVLCVQGPGAGPVVKSLLAEGESLEVIDSYYAIPVSALCTPT